MDEDCHRRALTSARVKQGGETISWGEVREDLVFGDRAVGKLAVRLLARECKTWSLHLAVMDFAQFANCWSNTMLAGGFADCDRERVDRVSDLSGQVEKAERLRWCLVCCCAVRHVAQWRQSGLCLQRLSVIDQTEMWVL